MITRENVITMLERYFSGELPLEGLVAWAEDVLVEGEVAPVSAALARLGLADVRAFGLTWEDTRLVLASLGYRAQVQVEAA